MVAFASSEHVALAPPNLPEVTLASGVTLPLRYIIALAGDYFSSEKPISSGTTPEEKSEIFMRAFNTLNYAEADEVNQLIQMINKERKHVDQALQYHHPESDALQKYGAQETFTAMKCTEESYLNLAKNNLDHFNNQALDAYQTGHTIAMKIAFEANQTSLLTQKEKLFNFALSLEAFACHFLTDLFAAGHMRTPRKELQDQLGPDIGPLFSLFQHDEDNREGLLVATKRDKWKAYGDGHLFEAENEENRLQAQDAVKQAFQEIYSMYEKGHVLLETGLDVVNLIPKVIENFPPLFKVEQHQIFYRKKLHDLSCDQYLPLTREKIPGILIHFAGQYAQESAVSKKSLAILDEIKKKERLAKEARRSNSLFYVKNTIKQAPVSSEEKKRCCVIV